jgi:hypothetical protein
MHMKFTRPLLIAAAVLAVVGARARDFVRLTVLPDKERA